MTAKNRVIGMIISVIFLLLSILVGPFILSLLSPEKGPAWFSVSLTVVIVLVATLSGFGILHYSGYFRDNLRRYEKANDGWEGAFKTSVELFYRARNKIKIVSGALSRTFYSHSEVVKALEDAINRGVKIEIVTARNFDKSNKDLLNLLKKYQDSISLYTLPKRPVHHFMVVDDKYFRREKKHKKEDDDRRAVVYFNSQSTAAQLSSTFDILKKNASKVSINSI